MSPSSQSDRVEALDPIARLRVWLRIARHPSVLRRSVATCLLVGAILVAINHGDAVMHGRIDAGLASQIVLTFLVPFAVATISSVAAIQGHVSPTGTESPTRDLPAEAEMGELADLPQAGENDRP